MPFPLFQFLPRFSFGEIPKTTAGTMDILVVQCAGRGLVVKRPGVLRKVQMLNLVLGVGVFSLLPILQPEEITYILVLYQLPNFTFQLHKHISLEVVSRKLHIMYSFVIQKVACKICLGSIFCKIGFQLHTRMFSELVSQ